MTSLLSFRRPTESPFDLAIQKYNIDVLMKDLYSTIKGKIANTVELRTHVPVTFWFNFDYQALKSALELLLQESLANTTKGFVDFSIRAEKDVIIEITDANHERTINATVPSVIQMHGGEMWFNQSTVHISLPFRH